MRQKSVPARAPAEQVVKDIRRATRRHFSAEDKIRIVLEGLRGEESIAELCRHEEIVQNLYYRWSKEFLEAGKKRLAGDTARAATSDEVKALRREVSALKEVVAEPDPREPCSTLLVTNDFPPKIGGIQSYLWELWRRLPSDDVTVLTTPYPGAAAWDAAQPFRVERVRERVLLPTPSLRRRIDAPRRRDRGGRSWCSTRRCRSGSSARTFGHPYGLVLHGAEVTVPGRLPGTRAALGRVLRGATRHRLRRRLRPRRSRARRRPDAPCRRRPARRRRRAVPAADRRRAQGGSASGSTFPLDAPLVVGRQPARAPQGLRRAHPGRRRRCRAAIPISRSRSRGSGRDRQPARARSPRRRTSRVRFLGRVPDDLLPQLYGVR